MFAIEMVHMAVRWLNKIPTRASHVWHILPQAPMYGLIFSVAMDKPKCEFLQAVFRGEDGTECVVKVTMALFLVAMHANSLIENISSGPSACVVLDDNTTMSLLYEGHDMTSPAGTHQRGGLL